MSAEHILIIDDSADSRRWIIDSVIRPAGYNVIEADNVVSARAILATVKPHVVVLNVEIGPEGGLPLLAMREATLPVIVLTTHRSLDEVAAALNAGAFDVLIRPFEPERLASSIARALKIAKVVNERDALREQTEHQVQEFNAIYTVGKLMTGMLDVERILTLVVTAAANLTHAEEGTLMLVDPGSGELYLRASHNMADATTRNLRVQVSDSLIGRVLQSRRPIMMSGNDLLKVQTWFLVRSILCVPLIAGNHVTGVLSVHNRISGHAFNEHEVHLLSTLADYAAIAIETARLYSQADRERAQLDTILRGIQDVVLVTDPNMRILLVNNAACETFNLSRKVVGRPLAEVMQIQAVRDLFDPDKLQSRAWRAEIILPDGRTLQGQVAKLGGVGYGAVMHDISRLKELDLIKSEFVSIVSHDLRTPLTTIRGFVNLLPRVGPLNPQQMEFVNRVERSMSDIVDLISDLLDIGKIEAGLDWQMETIELQSLVTKTVERVRPNAEELKHTLITNIAECAQVQGNARRLEQVIANLIGNAIKYTPEGGKIEVVLKEDGDFLVLQVRDNGIGISVEDQHHIFDKFYRVESEATQNIGGSGLGLSIVKAIAEKHQGRVWVESELGKGSTFTMLLPKQAVIQASPARSGSLIMTPENSE